MCRSKNVSLVYEDSDSKSDSPYVISAISNYKKMEILRQEIVSYTVITGKVILPAWQLDQKKSIKFNIIDGNYRPIVSLDTSIALGIMNLEHCDILALGIQRMTSWVITMTWLMAH